MSPSIVISLSLVGSGVLIAILTVPLILGRVPMNRWYGVRFTRSFESDHAWYSINRYGGRWLLVYGLALCVLGVVAFVIDPAPRTPLFWLLLFGPLLLLPLMLIPLGLYVSRFR